MKMLAGTLRRGSGITGFGGAAIFGDGAIAVGGLGCGSAADIWNVAPLRASGAGRGSGVVCALAADIRKPAANVAARPVAPARRHVRLGTFGAAACWVSRLIKTSSCSAMPAHFSALCVGVDIANARRPAA